MIGSGRHRIDGKCGAWHLLLSRRFFAYENNAKRRRFQVRSKGGMRPSRRHELHSMEFPF